MLILQRYYIKEFFKLFSLLSIGLSLIFSILNLIEKMDDFLPHKPSLYKLFLYTFFNFPKYLLYLFPAALLISTLFVFSQASRNRELITVRSSGGKLRSLLYPFITIGLLISIFSFITGEIIVPDFLKKAKELQYAIKKKEQKFTFQKGTLWLMAENKSLVRIELYIPEKKFAKGISIFIMDRDNLIKRIEAEEAYWNIMQGNNGTWVLKNVTVYDIHNGNIHQISDMKYPYLVSPENFTDEIKNQEEMGIYELYRYIEKIKSLGFKNTKLVVDLNAKISYPLINIFMIILGISLSIKSNFGGGMFAAGLGLLMSTIYWFGYTMTLSMGYAGIIPAMISPWIMPFIFGLISISLFKKIPE